jgi:hypothetical protein
MDRDVGTPDLRHLHVAAARLRANLAPDRCNADAAAAGLGVEAAAGPLDANVARPGARAHGAVEAADGLVARPGARVHLRVGRHDELVADADVVVGVVTPRLADADDVAVLRNRRRPSMRRTRSAGLLEVFQEWLAPMRPIT